MTAGGPFLLMIETRDPAERIQEATAARCAAPAVQCEGHDQEPSGTRFRLSRGERTAASASTVSAGVSSANHRFDGDGTILCRRYHFASLIHHMQ